MTCINKKIGPGIKNITKIDEVEKILNYESKVVLGYLNSLVVCVCALCFLILGFCVVRVASFDSLQICLLEVLK